MQPLEGLLVMAERPQVIFLDAAGTLIGVKEGVGRQYANVAARFGVNVAPEILNQAFIRVFKSTGSPAFPDCPLEQLQSKEFLWWKKVALRTFTEAEVIHQFSDFNRFFVALFDYFATAEPWFIYPDVAEALERWHWLGIPMGILSNFDSRLYSVLFDLNLIDYFTSITLSTEAGFAKPDRRIFHLALTKHECRAAQAWHIGDSFEEDYQAAQAAGLHGIWLRR
jgi:putative hydrolase of the HAD superfamily